MRVRRSVTALVVMLLAVPVLGGPARAGGSWLAPERSAYVAADTAVFRGVFSTGSREGRIADGPYVAYLLPERRWIRDHVIPASAIRVGELTIFRTSGHLFRARVAFAVPDVPTGMYHVLYCNEPCTVDGIGDLLGSESIAIGATATEARLLVLTQRLRWKTRAAVTRARQEGVNELKLLRETLAERSLRLSASEARVDQLAGELTDTRNTLRIERSSRSWGPAAGALLVLGLCLLAAVVVLAARLRRARVDAEIHALTHDEPMRSVR